MYLLSVGAIMSVRGSSQSQYNDHAEHKTWAVPSKIGTSFVVRVRLAVACPDNSDAHVDLSVVVVSAGPTLNAGPNPKLRVDASDTSLEGVLSDAGNVLSCCCWCI